MPIGPWRPVHVLTNYMLGNLQKIETSRWLTLNCRNTMSREQRILGKLIPLQLCRGQKQQRVHVLEEVCIAGKFILLQLCYKVILITLPC